MRIHEFLNSLSQKHSWAFRAWQLIILFLRSITLLAFAWIGIRAQRGYDAWSIYEFIPHGLVGQLLTVLSIAEVIFCLCSYWHHTVEQADSKFILLRLLILWSA